jgi:FKBP-type peptidyl-prolyl cis-trans isomerase SlpA
MSESQVPVIGPDNEVTLHFRLSLEDGQLIDSTFDKAPGTLIMGDETLPPGIMKLLLGLKAGDKRAFVVKPEQSFGEYNEKNLQQIPQEQFNQDEPLQEGMILQFQGPGDYALPGVVRRVLDGLVIVDFNHPLAGRTLLFDVEIVSVTTPAQPVTIQ